MASSFEVVMATTAIVTTFQKSAIILTMLKEKRKVQEKKNFVARRPKNENEFKLAEAELETSLHKGAEEIRRDFTTYCDRFGKDFSIGDQTAQLRFNEIKEDAKGMYRILEFARELDIEDCKKIRNMAESTKNQTQAAMADFQLRLLRDRPAKAPLNVHPAFQNNSLETSHRAELPTQNSLTPSRQRSPHSDGRPSFETGPVEIENWPHAPSSNSEQDGDRSDLGDVDSRRSTFTSSINSSEDSDYRSRAGTSCSSNSNSYNNSMTPMTPVTPTSAPINFSIPMIRHPSEGADEHAPGRISPVIEETKSQIYSIEQPTGTETTSAQLPPQAPQSPNTNTTTSESTPQKEPTSFLLAPSSSQDQEENDSVSNRSRSQSDANRSRSPLRARSPFRFSGGSLSALGMLPLSPNILHKRNVSENDARTRSPDTRGAIIAASATLSSITSNSNGTIAETEAPKRSNDWHGFCKGVWKVMEKGTKGLSAERRPIGIGYKAYEMYWQCKDCRFQGPMPNPNGKERHTDTRIRYSRSGVQYRWMFLAKSHVQSKTLNEIPAYRCLVCHYNGQTSEIFKGDETLMEHISEIHGDNISIEIQRRTSTVQGREPHPGEDWELYIPKRDKMHKLSSATDVTPLPELDGELGNLDLRLEKEQASLPAAEFASLEAEKVDLMTQARKASQPVQSTKSLKGLGIDEEQQSARSSPTSKPAKVLGIDEDELKKMLPARDTEADAERARKDSEVYRKYRVQRAHGSFSI